MKSLSRSGGPRLGGRRIGRTPVVKATGGGSDANIFNAKGLPTAVLGVGFEAIHSFRESMPVEELVKLTEMVLALATSP